MRSSPSPFEFSSLHMPTASSSSSSSPAPKAPKKPTTTKPPTRTHRPASLHSNPRPKSMDMSRLLDPAYLPSSSRAHHPAGPSHVSAFIDTNGDAHDPDYRHFPISPSARRRAARHSSAHSPSYNNTGYNSGYNNSGYGYNYNSAYGSAETRRPAWWSDEDEAVLSEYEDGEGEGDEDEEDADSEPFFLSSGAHPQNGARYKAGGAAAYRRRRRSLPGGGGYSGSYTGSGYGGSAYGGSAYGGSAYNGSAYAGSTGVYERGQSTTMSMRGSPTLCGRKRDGSFSTSTTTSASGASSGAVAAAAAWYAGHSPATTASTLPTSWESERGVLGRLWRGKPAEEGEEEKEKREGGVMKKIRRLSRGDKEKEKEKEKEEESSQRVPAVYRASDDISRPVVEDKDKGKVSARVVSHNAEEEDDDDEEEEEERRQRKEREEYVPTCGQSLRRQWAAVSLRFRFSLFRAQRRISRRVNSLR